MAKYEVGQKVLLVPGYGNQNPVEVPVVRVGRTLVYVERYLREIPFYIEDGRERRGPNSIVTGDRIYTYEEWAEKDRRKAVVKALYEAGIRTTPYAEFPYTTEALEKILKIAQEEK